VKDVRELASFGTPVVGRCFYGTKRGFNKKREGSKFFIYIRVSVPDQANKRWSQQKLVARRQPVKYPHIRKLLTDLCRTNLDNAVSACGTFERLIEAS
jgi:hypothetical protein